MNNIGTNSNHSNITLFIILILHYYYFLLYYNLIYVIGELRDFDNLLSLQPTHVIDKITLTPKFQHEFD